MRRTLLKASKNIIFYHKKKRQEYKDQTTQYKTWGQFGYLLQHYVLEGLIFITEVLTTSWNFVKTNTKDIHHALSDITQSNINCAKKQFDEGNYFDACFRLKAMLFFSKNNQDILLMLGYFYYLLHEKSIKHASKSAFYLSKLSKIQGDNTAPEVSHMLYEMQNIVNNTKQNNSKQTRFSTQNNVY